jgi:hypothetical protein
MLLAAGKADPEGPTSIWGAVRARDLWWLDLVIVGVCLLCQLIAVLEAKERTANLDKHADALRNASSAGLTVAGILLPLSFLAIQLRTATSPTALSDDTLADFFMASGWLFLSLAAGLYVVYVAGMRGPEEDVATRKDVGILFGAQLFFLLAAAWRLVWAVSSVITSLLK